MKRRHPPPSSYRRRPVSTADVDPGLRRDDTKQRRFTLEELVAGMTPGNEHPLEDDGPFGDELI
jgi:hypothetical protein